jgi:hypothetical protein
LYEPDGEIADLALLPGLGDERAQRRALLQEALVRPLAHFGLCLAGAVSSGWALVRLASGSIEPILFLVAWAAAQLMVFAIVSVGILSGRLNPSSPWSKYWMVYFLIPTVPALLSTWEDFKFVSAPAGSLSSSTWPDLIWLLVLAAMAVCLGVWSVRLSHRRNLLCR